MRNRRQPMRAQVVTTIVLTTASSAPAIGWTFYVDSGDSHKLKTKASNGTVVTLGAP